MHAVGPIVSGTPIAFKNVKMRPTTPEEKAFLKYMDKLLETHEANHTKELAAQDKIKVHSLFKIGNPSSTKFPLNTAALRGVTLSYQ